MSERKLSDLEQAKAKIAEIEAAHEELIREFNAAVTDGRQAHAEVSRLRRDIDSLGNQIKHLESQNSELKGYIKGRQDSEGPIPEAPLMRRPHQHWHHLLNADPYGELPF